jgi:hypothetical protein
MSTTIDILRAVQKSASLHEEEIVENERNSCYAIKGKRTS